MKLPFSNLEDTPLILASSGNSFFSNTGSFVLGFHLELMEVYSLASDDFTEIHTTWERALKNLPSGTIVHKQDYFLENDFGSSQFKQENFLQKATASHFKGRIYLKHSCLLFFSFSKFQSLEKIQLKSALQKIDLTKIQRQEDYLHHEFSNEVAKAVSFLTKSGFFRLKPLSSKEIYTYAHLNLNLDPSITTSALFNEKNSKNIKIGTQEVGIYGLGHEMDFPTTFSNKKKDPTYSSRDFIFYRGLGDHFGLHLPFSHIYNQIIYIDDHKYWIYKIEKRKELLRGLRNFSPEIKVQYQVLETMLEEIYKSDEDLKFVRAHFNVVFWNSQRETFLKYAHEITNTFKELDFKPTSFEKKELGHVFLNSHFACSSNFSNLHLALIPLNASICLLSNVTNYKNDPSGIYFNDRLSNIPVQKDVWDENKRRIKARNFALFAPTGEGKSVLANHIIRQFIDDGYTVVIVDLGGSYEKLASLYKDSSIYYKFEQNEALAYNPFSIETLEKLDTQKIESLSEFIFLHIKRGSELNEKERVSLKKIIAYYYKNLEDLNEAHFTNFIHFVNQRKDELQEKLGFSSDYFDFTEFKHLSSEFLPGGGYSFLYNQKPHRGKAHRAFNFKDKSLIVADLDELKDNRLLLSIYLQMLNEATDENIWKDKKKKGIILYDEFAKQLQFEEVLNRVIYYAQAIRKQNGALGIILQSINQLPDKVEVRAMLENIQVIYCLKNQGGYRELVDRLNLNTHQHYQLQSIQNDFSGPYPYSEFWLRLGNESNVYRLELPTEALYAYLTEGKENSEILDLFKETGSMEEAIKLYKKKKNYGK